MLRKDNFENDFEWKKDDQLVEIPVSDEQNYEERR